MKILHPADTSVMIGVIGMADYQQLYHLLFNHITDTIESLQMIQRQAETMYVNSPDPQLTLLPGVAPPAGESGVRSEE